MMQGNNHTDSLGNTAKSLAAGAAVGAAVGFVMFGRRGLPLGAGVGATTLGAVSFIQSEQGAEGIAPKVAHKAFYSAIPLLFATAVGAVVGGETGARAGLGLVGFLLFVPTPEAIAQRLNP